MDMNLNRIYTTGKFLVVGLIIGILLAGCGGKSSGAASTGSTPTAAVSITGTAAAGAPVANGAGYALDATSGKTIPFTTDVNGKYSLVLTGYSGPFILHVVGLSSSGAPVNMYSLATTSNNGGTVNISPLTDTVLGYASGANTQALEYYCTANPTACAAQLNTTYSALTAANTVFVAAISAAMPSSLPSGFNAFTTPFNADHTGVDGLLDKVTVTPAVATGAGAYQVSLVAEPTISLITLPTTGTVGTLSTTLPSSAVPSTVVLTKVANLAAILPEIQTNVVAPFNAAANSTTSAAFATALTPLLDATFLHNGATGTTFLSNTTLNKTIPLGTTITGGAIALYSNAPLIGATPAAGVTFDLNNCVTSAWVHLSLNGMNAMKIKLVDTGYNTTTCLGGTWAIAGNQRQFKSKLYAQSFNMVMTGAAPFTKPTLAFDIPNAQVPVYTSVVISGTGLVTLGAQTILSAVTLIPTAANLKTSNTITDSYYGGTSANKYTGGMEGSDSLVSCAWIGTHPNGWGASGAATPCFNGDAVAGSDYTIQFFNGLTLLETDMDRLHVTPSPTIPSSWYPVVTSVTPVCTGIPVTGTTVTANWTLPAGSVTNGIFLNLNDATWDTVNNSWNMNLAPNATSASLLTGPMLTSITATPTPAPTNCGAAIATTVNDISVVTFQQF